MTTPELAPCPFQSCGSTNIAVFCVRVGAGKVICWDCGACGPVRSSRHEAIDAWNRRATPPADPERERRIETCLNAINLMAGICPTQAQFWMQRLDEARALMRSAPAADDRLRDAIESHVHDLVKRYQPAPNMEGTFTGPPSIARLIDRLLAAIGKDPLRRSK